MEDQAEYARFVRKPRNLGDLSGYGQLFRVTVSKTVEMDEAQYDLFTAKFLYRYDFLDGEGGSALGGGHMWVKVVKVVAPNRATLYVNPEGYDYARYVAFANQH